MVLKSVPNQIFEKINFITELGDENFFEFDLVRKPTCSDITTPSFSSL